jgi:glycosyltransferase involved in cell wall biosynthesis
MKVLMMTERFAPDFAGGGEVMTLETARLMRGKGCDLSVLTTGNPADTEYEGIPVRRLPTDRYRFNLCAQQATDAARGADLIHVCGFHACVPGLVAARRLSIPILWSLAALFGRTWREMKPPFVGVLWQWFEQWLVHRPFDGLHLFSDASRSLAVSMGADGANCFVIPMGIRYNDFAPRWPKDRTVLFSGKLEARKGIFELLEAAARLPQVRFEIVGWGPLEATLRARATANVTFHRFERGAKLREHFARASIFAMPSYVETFGLALVEAQASGCAIVSSVPLEFKGITIPPRDADALARAIETLWSDPAGTEQAGHENVALARQYDWERYADRLFAEYSRLIDCYQPLTRIQPMEMSL